MALIGGMRWGSTVPYSRVINAQMQQSLGGPYTDEFLPQPLAVVDAQFGAAR
ncbi:MAG: hypothetical protein ACP5P4_14750 [Steroidobacteraceae bacterium]